MSEATSNRRLLILLAAAGLLAVAVTADLFWNPAQESGKPTEIPTPNDTVGERDGFERVAPSVDDFHDIEDRPLFSPSRRKAVLPGEGGPDGTAGPGLMLGEAQLVGLVSSSGRRFAVFQRQPGQPSVRIEEGQELGGWRLVEVSPREAIFEQNGSRKALRLFHAAGASADAEQTGPRPIIPTDSMLGIGKQP